MSKITYPNKATGDTFSGAEATEIKTIVNANDDELIALSSEVDLNTDKVGITTEQSDDIVANNDKISYTDSAEVAANTDKVGITTQQAADITTNNSKINDVIAGTNVTIDKTDPLNPVISSVGGDSALEYTSIALAMAVDPLPANNTPFIVRGSGGTDDGYYIYDSNEAGGYFKTGEFTSADLNDGAFDDTDNVTAATQKSTADYIAPIKYQIDSMSVPYYIKQNLVLQEGYALKVPTAATGTDAAYFRTTSANYYQYTDGDLIMYTGEIDNLDYAGVFYSNGSAIIGYELNEIGVFNNYELTIPDGTTLIAVCSVGEPILSIKAYGVEFDNVFNNTNTEQVEIINENLALINPNFTLSYTEKYIPGTTYGRAVEKDGGSAIGGAAANYYATSVVSSSAMWQYIEGEVITFTGEIENDLYAGVVYFDIGLNFLGYDAGELKVYDRETLEMPPQGTVYIAGCSFGIQPVLETKELTLKGGSLLYVDASNESGTGNGTSTNPYPTIGEAIESASLSSNSIIQISEGDYREVLDLANLRSGDFKLIAKENNKVRVLGSDKLEGFTLHSGNTYKATFIGAIPAWGRADNPIFEDGNPSKPILANEVHSLQKGLSNRLPFTPIYEVGSIALVEATIGSYYYDGVDTIYIHTSDSDNPETNGFNYEIPQRDFNTFKEGSTTKDETTLIMEKIQFMFGTNGVSFEGFQYVERRMCTVLACTGIGAFLDDTGWIVSYNDEAGFCDNDGFNGHFGNFIGGTLNPDNRSQSPQAIYYDLWTHDNHDDGISHHENSNGTVRGGLIEYNGDGGWKVATDGNWLGYNIISRQNGQAVSVGNSEGNGFASVNPTTNPYRNGCHLTLFNCVAENNNSGYASLGVNNIVEMINCISRNNTNELYADTGIIYSRNSLVTNATPANKKVELNGGIINILNDELLT